MVARFLPTLCMAAGIYIVYGGWESGEPKAKLFGMLTMGMMVICSVYGNLFAVIASTNLTKQDDFVPGYITLALGIMVGVANGGAIIGLAYFGKAFIQAVKSQPRVFVMGVLTLIYIEAMALYGLIVGLSGVVTAQKIGLDLAAGTSFQYAFDFCGATIGGIVGSAYSGIAIAKACQEQGRGDMKWLMPIVFNGVTSIYGLIGAIVAAEHLPGVGAFAMIPGLLYLVSSAGLTHFGYTFVMDVAGDSQMFLPAVTKLIMSQSIGLLGLCISLFSSGALLPEANPDEAYFQAHGQYDANVTVSFEILVETSVPSQWFIFALVAAVATFVPVVALRGRDRAAINQAPLLA